MFGLLDLSAALCRVVSFGVAMHKQEVARKKVDGGIHLLAQRVRLFSQCAQVGPLELERYVPVHVLAEQPGEWFQEYPVGRAVRHESESQVAHCQGGNASNFCKSWRSFTRRDFAGPRPPVGVSSSSA